MDDHVLRGIARWPNVPAVYGWLALDRRGNWLLKGDRIANPMVTDFIGRNYEHDAGRWFFQNGPQRVYVELEYTPFVMRVTTGGGSPLELCTHTRVSPGPLIGAYIDENGEIVLHTAIGAGVVDARDLDAVVAAIVDASGAPPPEDELEALVERLQSGGHAALWLDANGARVELAPLSSADAPRRFGYDPRPTAPAGHPECK